MSVAMFLSLQGEPVQSDRTEEETGQVSAWRSDELYGEMGDFLQLKNKQCCECHESKSDRYKKGHQSDFFFCLYNTA